MLSVLRKTDEKMSCLSLRDQCEGILYQAQMKSQSSLKGSLAHVDPAGAKNWAKTVKATSEDGPVNKKQKNDKETLAVWLLVKPSSAVKFMELMKRDKKLTKMTKTNMETVVTQLDGGAEIVEQTEDEIVQVPIGYIHAVANQRACYKVARDVIPKDTLYLCAASYICIWRLFRNYTLTADYTSCLPQLVESVCQEEKIIRGSRDERKKKVSGQ